MKFVSIYMLNFLWALIPVLGVLVYGMLKRNLIIASFTDHKMLSSIIPGHSPHKRWIKIILVIAAMGLAIVAMAGPQTGYKWEKIQQRGVDIMIALDCSRSMLTKDIKPNRLERAKREIIDFLRMMKSDRAGLVAFSGDAVLQCPLTLDRQAFNIFLNVLKPGYLPVGGTNINKAIKTSFDGFDKDSDTQKAILLITDGEATAGQPREMAEKMSQMGIKIFCIGIGGSQGAPIPDEQDGFKKDAAGNIVLSRVDEKGLEELSHLTGGAYVRSVAGDMDLEWIYQNKILGTMEKKEFESGKKKVWENRYQWFLLPCLILLLVEFILFSKKQGQKMLFMILGMGLHLIFFQNADALAASVFSNVKNGIEFYEAQAFEKAKQHFIDAQLEDPENQTLYYNIGAAAYQNKEYELALDNFIQAIQSEDPVINHDARFNLANTYYRLGRFDEAIKEYEQILKEFPDDQEAKENLEFVKNRKKERKNQVSRQNQNQQSKKTDQDKEQEPKDEKQNGSDQNRQQYQAQNRHQSRENEKEKKDSDPDNKNKIEPETQNNQHNFQKPDQESHNDANQKEEESLSFDTRTKRQSDDTDPHKAKMLENKLNRLEDKPGRAMILQKKEQRIQKDW